MGRTGASLPVSATTPHTGAVPGAASTTAASGVTSPGSRSAHLRAGFAPPALRRVQVSTAGSFAGDAIAAVAFGVLAYRAAGPGGVALLVAVQMLPAAALMPFVSLAADKLPRERLLLAVDGGRVLLALTAFMLEATGQPRLALLPLAAGLTTATAASNTLRRSLVPLIVGSPRQLTATGVASSFVQALVQTLGPMLAAVLLALASPGRSAPRGGRLLRRRSSGRQRPSEYPLGRYPTLGG